MQIPSTWERFFEKAFLRRLYVTGNPLLKQHHHIRINTPSKKHLSKPDVFYRGFIQAELHNAEVLDIYSDASQNFDLGFGAYCSPEWTYGQWPKDFCLRVQPSIEYLELFGSSVELVEAIQEQEDSTFL